MKILLSPRFRRTYKKIIKKKPAYSKLVRKTLKILQKDPQHPSLRLHKLKGEHREKWSITLKRNLRLTYHLRNGYIILIDIGTHDQVY